MSVNKSIDVPIPITIISGFLGSGKTSLLRHILQSDHAKRMAVLINDFGQLNVDAELISTIEGQTIGLTNGCICCTIRDDLLTEVLKLFERKEIPEHIIIEASGISDPSLIAHTFLMPAMQGVVEVDSIVSVVDASEILQMDQQFNNLAQKQIRVADLVIINKIDLINTSKLENVRNYVEKISTGKRIVETVNSQVPLNILLGTQAFDPAQIADTKEKIDVKFETWAYESDKKFTFMAIRKMLEKIPVGVYRVKGFVHLEAMPHSQGIFQMTGGRAWLRLGEYWNIQNRMTRLVFIGKINAINNMQLKADIDSCQQNYCRKELDKSIPIKVENMNALSIVFG